MGSGVLALTDPVEKFFPKGHFRRIGYDCGS